jgi:hypothetical protein
VQLGLKPRHAHLLADPPPHPAPKQPLRAERGGRPDVPQPHQLLHKHEQKTAGLHAPEPLLDHARVVGFLPPHAARDFHQVFFYHEPRRVEARPHRHLEVVPKHHRELLFGVPKDAALVVLFALDG